MKPEDSTPAETQAAPEPTPEPTPELKPNEVMLGGEVIRLAAPRSPALRWDIFGHTYHNVMRAQCAALGMCWRSKGAPKANLGACSYNVGDYGAKVMDELLGRGLKYGEIMAAGSTAIALLVVDLVSEEEVSATDAHFPE